MRSRPSTETETKSSLYKYTAETTNAGIRVRLPAEAGLGVRVTAHGMGVDLGPDSHRFAIDHESHDGPTHTLIAATQRLRRCPAAYGVSTQDDQRFDPLRNGTRPRGWRAPRKRDGRR